MNAIEIKDLCKTYSGFALDHVNLTLPCGCIMGLIGENGAGKSTTIRLMLDMIKRDSGSITLLGKDNRESPRLLKEEIGVVLDEVGIPACLNPRQVGRIMAESFRNWEQSVYDGLLDRLDIPREKPFKEFSKGMKMKLGIAVALSHRPRLLILDEATAGLDPVVRDEVLDLFCEFTRDESHAILISSHIVSDLEKICDYVAFLHKGRLLLCEDKDVLKEEYAILRCQKEQLDALSPEAVIGKKETKYGVEAIVRRDAVPGGLELSAMDIEELFIFMVKEANRQ